MNHLTRSDAKLLAASDKDAAAFRALYDRYTERIKGYHLRRCHDEEAALDLTAETFAQAWYARRSFRDEVGGSAGPWLYGIARNVLLQSVRRARLEDGARLRLGMLELADRPPAAPEESWLNGVDELLDELPAEQRAAGVMTRRTRPRLLAGGTLGLVGVGAALVLALSAGGAAAPPAFAVTSNSDGSVLVNLKFYSAETIPAVNRKLTAMGIDEQILTTWQASGPAPVSGPVNCTPWRDANVPGPPVKVLLGTDGTQVVGSGVSADNTGEGTYHVINCFIIKTGATVSGNSGDSGNTGGS